MLQKVILRHPFQKESLRLGKRYFTCWTVFISNSPWRIKLQNYLCFRHPWSPESSSLLLKQFPHRSLCRWTSTSVTAYGTLFVVLTAAEINISKAQVQHFQTRLLPCACQSAIFYPCLSWQTSLVNFEKNKKETQTKASLWLSETFKFLSSIMLYNQFFGFFFTVLWSICMNGNRAKIPDVYNTSQKDQHDMLERWAGLLTVKIQNSASL